METSETALATPAKLDLPNQLFQEFYADCSWHLKPDLQVTAQDVDLFGQLAAAEISCLYLRPDGVPVPPSPAARNFRA